MKTLMDRVSGARALAFVALCLSTLTIAGSAPARAEEAPIAVGQETNGKARAEILSLKRTEGDTVTLRFAIVNDNRSDMSLTLGNMKLLDIANRRSYDIGLKSESCRIPSGERRVCWAVFGAPNANPRTLVVKFYDDFDLISVPFTN